MPVVVGGEGGSGRYTMPLVFRRESGSGQVTMPMVVGGENRRAQESESARARGSAASVPLREDRCAYIYLSCNTERQ
jgi:hypothetical protein